ncbi:MAG: EAL domain-containing protein [Gloeomargaritaceae cyanobacterium C42_A2020_066]|nr:EAL domain-containing protein [Gloeomargaritaceae cyanobacterium C42_A2020_066]
MALPQDRFSAFTSLPRGSLFPEPSFQRLMQSLPVGIQVWDAQGEHLWSNAAALRLLDLTPKMLRERRLQDRLWNWVNEAGQPMAPHRFPVFEALTTGRPVPRTVLGLYRPREWHRVWLMVDVDPHLDEQGEVTHVVCTYTDITPQRLAEAQLRHSEERYALAVNGARDGIWDWDLLTDRLYLSDQWHLLLGYSPGSLGEEPSAWFDHIHPQDGPRVRQQLLDHLAGHQPTFESEHRLRHCQGNYRWVLVRGLAVRDTDGQVYRMAGSQTDITERKHAEAELWLAATHDALTGLANRYLFLDRLGRALESARQDPTGQFGVLLLDLDRFKVINDSLGHLVGDELLMRLAQRLRAQLDPDYLLARLGGDEFAVLVPTVARPAGLCQVAEQLQQVLSAAFCVGSDSYEVYTTASIGIVVGGTAYDRPQDVLRDADVALHQAKGQGKARYALFDGEMRAKAVRQLKLENALRQAIERQELCLHYQPVVNLQTGQLQGFEALARWQHPELGWVSPSEFITLAEETGQIIPLGQWVLRTACQQLKQWQQQWPTQAQSLSVSVNLSAYQFAQTALVTWIDRVLEEVDLPPAHLQLEITESTLGSYTEAETTLAALKSLGLKLCIDDFGTGHSSLSRLHSFPIDHLKIDRAFVGRMDREGNGRDIIDTILSLAQRLKLAVIAEGIETPTQLDLLQGLGCQAGQGFFLAPPLAPPQATTLVAAGRCPALSTEKDAIPTP